MTHYAVPLNQVLACIKELREHVSRSFLNADEYAELWDEWLDIMERYDLNPISQYFQERYPALEEQTV